MDNKKDFIAKKMKILMGEGKYDKSQAFAIANSYADKKFAQQGLLNQEQGLLPIQDKKIISAYKPISYIQKGVQNKDGINGVYIWYKRPGEKGFNVETDREFVPELYFSQIKQDPSMKNEALDAYLAKNPTQKFQQAGMFQNFDMQNILSSQMMSPKQDFTTPPALATPSYANTYSPANYNSWDIDNNKIPDLVQRPEDNTSQKYDFSVTGVDTAQNNVDTVKQSPVTEQTYNTRYNIANPYGGYSPELMAMKSGEFFGKGNTGMGILAGAGSLLGFGRNFMSGLASGKENERVRDDYFDTLFSEKPNYVYQQGGDVKLTNAEFLTGQFVADEGKGNVNVEGGEYLQRQGNVQEVVGEPHIKNGKEHDGVNVNLNQGDKVLSNYTKIPAQTIKELKDRYELSLKKGATFADAQKAFDKKLGIQKTTDELAEYIEKFGKNESVKDETTKRLNASILAKEIEEYKGKLDELKQPQSTFFDSLFAIQEAIPKRGNGKTLFDKNGKEVTETNTTTAQQGGLIKLQDNEIQYLTEVINSRKNR